MPDTAQPDDPPKKKGNRYSHGPSKYPFVRKPPSGIPAKGLGWGGEATGRAAPADRVPRIYGPNAVTPADPAVADVNRMARKQRIERWRARLDEIAMSESQQAVQALINLLDRDEGKPATVVENRDALSGLSADQLDTLLDLARLAAGRIGEQARTIEGHAVGRDKNRALPAIPEADQVP